MKKKIEKINKGLKDRKLYLTENALLCETNNGIVYTMANNKRDINFVLDVLSKFYNIK